MCDSILPNPNPTTAQYEIARVAALENLAEIVGMYCERVPREVREALHKVPGIEKQHQCRMLKTDEQAAIEHIERLGL